MDKKFDTPEYQAVRDWLARLADPGFPLDVLLALPEKQMGMNLELTGKQGTIRLTAAFLMHERHTGPALVASPEAPGAVE